MLRQLITATVLVISSAITAQAGGPAFVAGSGYNQGVEGHPILWANGSLQYFTDQGDLSPVLPAAQADALVAGAFAAWTGIPGVGLTVTYSGHLAEDVNGGNIVADQYGNIGAPTDITSSATSTPVAIIYDSDGSVTDALLGDGAGSAADCFTNAVYGGPDNFNVAGNIAHALVIINGVCASTSAQLPDVQYRLVRILGRVLGLGWSQANLNVLTRKPVPTTADFAGFPVMHSSDPISCVPVSVCYPDAAVPKMDDMIALTKLYPGARNGQASGRVYGIVYFTDTSVNAAQPMQGVNVVARLMVGGQPSRQYVVTSVSGFRFTGNAGNIVNGYVDANGLRYDRWGSSDRVLEGYFDLGQLIIPSGQNIAQYQLSVEALDLRWSRTVGPYVPTQVTPSGSFPPVVVTVENGSDTERDMFMLQDAVPQTHPGSGSTYLNPVKLPSGGSWGSWIAGYGSVDFFQFTAQANRTASVSVMAYDESGQPTLSKLEPAIGVWQLSDQSGDPAPAATPSAFNTSILGMTRLDAQFGATGSYRVAIADSRGDGRPDYMYRARVLYADNVSPARLGLMGGVTSVNGIGFGPGLQLSVGASSGGILSSSASHLLVAMPSARQDGVATIQISDTSSGAFSQMFGAVAYGALETDLLKMLQAAEPATPVGAVAASPIRVRAVASDGTTPVSGATIAWSASNGLQFSACGGASSCSVLTDEAGESSTLVTPIAIGQSTITVALAPASYQTPQTQQTTVFGNSTSLDLAGVSPTRWIAQGASLSVPLTVEVLNLGLPKPNVTINFILTKGTASLSATTASTNASGFATVTATLANQNSDVQVSACVAPRQLTMSDVHVVFDAFFVVDRGGGQRILTSDRFGASVSAAHLAHHRWIIFGESGNGGASNFSNYARQGTS